MTETGLPAADTGGAALPAAFDLSGKIAMVTGAGSGLGAAEAQALAAAGAKVVIVEYVVDAGEAMVDRLRSQGFEASLIVADVGELSDIDRVFSRIVEDEGRLDILVNNAGVSQPIAALDADGTLFDRVFRVNTRGLYFMCQGAARVMASTGGTIVNIASIGGMVVDGPHSSVYDGSKAAVIQLTRNMAFEWAKYGIRVNAIAPGYMDTAMAARFLSGSADAFQNVVERVPLGRVGRPEDLMGPVLFLASPASGYVTGHTLNVDGGWVIV